MSDTLTERYGAKPQRAPLPKIFWIALTLIGVAVAASFGLWVQLSKSDQPVARDVGFELISADESSGTFEVVKNPADTAVCAVKALDSSRAPVGWKEVTISPTTDTGENSRHSVHTVHVRTLAEATTITVDSCWKP